MKIIVISDTHVSSLSELPSLREALNGVDLIVHCGDFTTRTVLEGLRQLGEVKAVCGNADSRELQDILPEKELFEIRGKKIGLVHGWGSPWRIAERIRTVFDDRDVILYGHSHAFFNGYINNSLMFNPGAARDSYGILTIDDQIKTAIVRF